MNSATHLQQIESLLRTGHTAELDRVLTNTSPEELVEVFGHIDSEYWADLFRALNATQQVKTFELLPFPIQKHILQSLPSDRAAQVLNALAPDDRTTFLEGLPSPVVNELLKLLSSGERALTLKLLGYPEQSVGRLMTPDYIAVKLDWTVQQVLEYVRKYGRYSETIDVIYVVDDYGRLIDDIKIKNFLFAAPESSVADLSDRKFVYLKVNDDEETAINTFRNNNRVALPVTDAQGILLGIVTFDDILDLARKEDTEDIYKIGGMEAIEDPYLQTPLLDLLRKRVGWLVILFLGEMLTATAIAFFEKELAKAVTLALFLPLIISSGGNSGSQASSLIIRALALGEVKLRDWWRVMRREIISGLFLGSVLGSIGFLRISVWTVFTDLYGPHWFLVAITVALALVGVVLWGTLMGSMLPLLLKRLKADPAASSAPFVATLVDVTGIIIYFSIASVVLSGTLL